LLFFIGILSLILVIYQWWRDISREGAIQGLHTSIVELGLRWGIALFIVSEIFFFVSFFWAFFHRRLAPNVEVGSLWPPFGIVAFNPFQVPLLNTIILISFGVRVIWAHHSLILGKYIQTTQGLAITVAVLITAVLLLLFLFALADAIGELLVNINNGQPSNHISHRFTGHG